MLILTSEVGELLIAAPKMLVWLKFGSTTPGNSNGLIFKFLLSFSLMLLCWIWGDLYGLRLAIVSTFSYAILGFY